MIPSKPPPSWFKSLDSIISKFYWKNKTPRIKLTTLQKPKTQGGLEAPNSHFYFIAQQLQYIHKWRNPAQSDNTWTDIEQTLCKDIHISDLPFISRSITHHPCFKNPAIATTLTAWWKFHQITNSTMVLNKHTPIWNNPDFLVNKKPLYFAQWILKGITHLQHVFHNNSVTSFSHLVQKYCIGDNHFFEFIQIKSCIASIINVKSHDLEPPPLISNILNITSRKKLLSNIYKLIATYDQTITLPSAKWENDLQINPSANFWTQICRNVFSTATNSNIQLIQYKIIHRVHYTGKRMFKMGFADVTSLNNFTVHWAVHNSHFLIA